MEFDNLVVILGAPRSGTTWLAKIFDSHPDVLYRHEPDLAVRSNFIPIICPEDAVDQYREATREFINLLLRDKNIKACGSLPVFRKDHDSTIFSYVTRCCTVYALKFLLKGVPARLHCRIGVPIIDGTASHRVLKSVSSLGRAGLILRSLPECKIVLIIRHPLEQVASWLRGMALNKFEKNGTGHQWLSSTQARRYGLTQASLGRLSLAEQLTWEWAILNEKAMDEVSRSPRVRVIRYVDLTDDPLLQAQTLFSFVGLPWRRETDRFIRDSTTFKGPDRYYQVYKNQSKTRDQWRVILSEDEKRQIFKVMRSVSLSRFWPESVDNP